MNMKILFLVILNAMITGIYGQAPTSIVINADHIVYEMAGGMGASWHAISASKIDEGKEYKWALRYINSRGSAWGGNPPVTDTTAWNRIYKYAGWLGLNWVRVELSARMYEPERNRFDWNNEEMQALYNILDWCEAHDADVFLQQMWSNVKWNAYPGVQSLLSAPRSLDDFAGGIGQLLEHLLKVKKYSCIKWICITNEPPGGTWGSWWSMGEKDASLTPALKAVRRVLDEKKLDVGLSGPDWTDLPPFDAKKIDFDSYINAYDIHSYQGIDEDKQKTVEAWASWAQKHGKPLFLSEIGDMRIGWKDTNPGPKSFEAALSNAESILRGLEAGAGAFNRWSFTNRGDLDGQWQLIRTWDVEKKEYLRAVAVEPVAFYGYGILTRFNAKHSQVLETRVSDNADVLCQALKSPSGKLTIYMLNKGEKEQSVEIQITSKKNNGGRLFLYQVTKPLLVKGDFKMDLVESYEIQNNKPVKIVLPPESISTLSRFELHHDEPGVFK